MQALAQALPGFALPAAPSCPNDNKPKPRKVRCQDRATRWRSDLERQYGRLIADARSPEEQAALEEAYNADLKRGPDFSRVRREAKTFGVPQYKGLDRNALAKLVFNFEMIERGLWKTDRQAAKDAGKKIKRTIPTSVLPVLRALARLTTKYAGRVFPSLEGLAVLAGVCRSTACQAIKLLETWGFLKITRRCKREMTPAGMRLVQDTSLYELHVAQGLAAMAARIFGLAPAAVQSGVSSGSEDHTASSTQTISPKEEVRFADLTPSKTDRLIPLPDTFDAPRRRIHWSELIRATK